MVEGLQAWLNATREGLASRGASVFYFLDGLDPEAVAYVTANSCLSRLHEEPRVVSCATHIAMRLEETTNLDLIAKDHLKLADKIAKRTAQIRDGKNRMVFVRKGADLADVKVVQWDDDVRVRVGTLLIEMFAQHTGLVAVETEQRGRATKSMHIRPTESCRKWLEEAHARCELLSPADGARRPPVADHRGDGGARAGDRARPQNHRALTCGWRPLRSFQRRSRRLAGDAGVEPGRPQSRARELSRECRGDPPPAGRAAARVLRAITVRAPALSERRARRPAP